MLNFKQFCVRFQLWECALQLLCARAMRGFFFKVGVALDAQLSEQFDCLLVLLIDVSKFDFDLGDLVIALHLPACFDLSANRSREHRGLAPNAWYPEFWSLGFAKRLRAK